MNKCAWCGKELPKRSPSRQSKTCSTKCGASLRWQKVLGDKERQRQKRQRRRDLLEARSPPRLCPVCQTKIKGRGKTCGKSCGTKLAIREGRKTLPNPPNSWGATNTNWKGGMKRVNGYLMVKVPPGTPGATQKGYMMEHRLVMQTHLQRPLRKEEQVHHRNGIKHDNRLENLEVITIIHKGDVVCPHCQKTFSVR